MMKQPLPTALSVSFSLWILIMAQSCSDNMDCDFGSMSDFSYADSLTVAVSPDSIGHLVFIEHYRSAGAADTAPIKVIRKTELNDTMRFMINVKATDYSSSARREFDSYKGHDTLYVWHTIRRPYFLPQKLFLAKSAREEVQCSPLLGPHRIDALEILCSNSATFTIGVIHIGF